jgi:hypothetical protein
MGWSESILDFIYLSFEWLGPFVLGPVIVLWLSLYSIAAFIFAPIMKALRIPSKYQRYFHTVLLIAVFLALMFIIAISLSNHPDLDWMKEPL